MKRRSDWQGILNQFMGSRNYVPFAWGQNDCALLVCDAVLEITGTDMAADVRGKYDSEESARALLGGLLADYAARVAEKHELPATDWKSLRRGDVGLIDTKDGGALGIVWMPGILSFPGASGLESVPVRMARRGWLIG